MGHECGIVSQKIEAGVHPLVANTSESMELERQAGV